MIDPQRALDMDDEEARLFPAMSEDDAPWVRALEDVGAQRECAVDEVAECNEVLLERLETDVLRHVHLEDHALLPRVA